LILGRVADVKDDVKLTPAQRIAALADLDVGLAADGGLRVRRGTAEAVLQRCF